MESLVKKEFVQITDSVKDWQSAVELSLQPLLDAHYIEAGYLQAIYDATAQYGPYYVLAPKIAMPHAKPEDGVVQKGIGLLLVKEPFKFSEDSFEVQLVISLAPSDSQTHLDSLVKLSEMLDDSSLLDQILNASSSEELYEFFKHI